MPLVKRAVSPVNISRGTIPASVQKEELQCAANGTLANLIRQLSSLSKHAENVFGEIYHDAMVLHHKSNTLQQRVERLHVKVSQLDSNNDQVTLNEANMRKTFKSSMLIDQHILDRSTLPAALAERYASCDPPPNLDALNEFRESEEPALSLYTNPSFFFDLWKKEALKEAGHRQRRVKSPGDGSKSPKKRRQRVEGTVQSEQRQKNNRFVNALRPQNNDLFAFPDEYQAPQALGLQLNRNKQQQAYTPMTSMSMAPPIGMSMHAEMTAGQAQGVRTPQNGRPTGPIRTAPVRDSPNEYRRQAELPPPNMELLAIDDDDDELPPPPPSMLMQQSIVHQLPSETQPNIQFVEPSSQPSNIPPPPPPPPPPMPTSETTSSAAAPSATFSKAPTGDAPGLSAEPKVDARSDLLAQIQSGIKLKKVLLANEAEAEKNAVEKNDVAAILKRRMDQVMGNRDDDSSEDGDDDEWDD